jgi:hypothetical protein
MRFGHPIIIYDSIAYQWLVENAGLNSTASYEDYCAVWRRVYEGYRPLISQISKELVEIRAFTAAFDWDKRELEALVDHEWFQERIFDHAMVNSVIPEEN